MKKFLLSYSFLFIFTLSFSKAQSFEFKGVTITSDENGNSYAAGIFRSPELKLGTTILKNSSGNDFFIIKYNNSGKISWAKNIDNNNELINSLDIDSKKNLVLNLVKKSSVIESELRKAAATREIKIDIKEGTFINNNFLPEPSVNKTQNDYITLVSPNGGEEFIVGLNYEIKWSTNMNFTPVKLEFSADNGTTWNYIGETETDDNFYRWVIPNVITAQGKMRIVSLLDTTLFDECDAVFSTSGELFWEIQDYKSSSLLNSVHFTDELNGWAAGYDGIINTTDGGETWNKQLDGGFFSVHFIDDNNGWASGFSGSVYKTTNGGINWDSLNTGIKRHLTDIKFVNENYGWTVGDTTIYRTTDGGETWNGYSPTDHILFAIDFINDSTGWTAGGEGVLFKTTDGGVSWTEQLSNGTYISVFNSVHFLNENIGWAAGNSLDMYGGIILKTTNGGENWSLSLGGNDINFIYDVYFTDSNNGWASGENGLIMKSTNGGNSWIQQGSGTRAHITSLCFLDEKSGWSSSDLGSVFKYSHIPVPPSVMLVNPVELSSFTASVNKNIIQLSWSTSSEKNNSGFEILRKSHERNENPEWIKIGFVAGKGTSSELNLYAFTDDKISSGKYSYKLKQIDYDGSFEFTEKLDIEFNAPSGFTLNQNYPNPFNPTTNFEFQIPDHGFVSLKVYDALGKEVATLINEEKPAGNYSIIFNANNLSSGGQGLASGVYYYVLTSGNFSSTKKMILLK